MCLIVGNPVYVLTPHVLSEWMVEVCRFYLCDTGVLVEVCRFEVCVLGFEVCRWCIYVWSWCDVIDIRCILYYILYIYYILFLLFYLSLFFYSSPLPNHTFILYLSVLTYTYLYSIFLILSHLPNNLTPHKLSEGCLEWCSFISIWFLWMVELVDV
jgi:hypothetical protein